MTQPTKTRPGDQALPTGVGTCVQDVIIEEMHESKRVGMERYGSVLRTFNGRRSIQDAREEARDLHVYLTQIDTEAKADRDELVRTVSHALETTYAVVGDFRLGAALTTAEGVASVAVDRIMGWVVGTRIDGRAEDFLEWLISLDDPDDPVGLEQRRTITLNRIIQGARAALGKVDD